MNTNCKTVTVILVQLLLIATFLVLISIKVVDWNNEAVGISLKEKDDGIMYLPSVTFCIDFHQQKEGNKTLNELVKIHPNQVFHNATYSVFQQHLKSAIKQENIKDWRHSFYLSTSYKSIWPCWTWNPKNDFIKAPQKAKYSFHVKAEKEVAMELHEKQHSKINYWWNPENIYLFRESAQYEIELKYAEHFRLKTKHYNCNDKGKARPFDCLQQFYNEKLKCNLPWTGNQTSICQSMEDKENLIELITNLANGTLMTDLKSRNCWIPNCQKKEWTRLSFQKVNARNSTGIEIKITMNTATLVQTIQENKLYGFTNFVSDFGGFMGLLLGYSIFSMVKSLIDFMTDCSLCKSNSNSNSSTVMVA